MDKRRAPLAAAIVIIVAILAASCSSDAAPATRERFVLGTVCRISVYGADKPRAVAEAFARLADVEARMSANSEDSEIARVSAAAGGSPVAVSADSLEVLLAGLDFARRTGGAFDPTVGPLVKLWGIGTDAARVPSAEEIRAALDLVDYRDVEVDEGRREVFLKRKGMALDLGAIAKGYAANEAVAILRKGGAKRAIIDLGGNIYAVGSKGPGKPFRIGIQDPERKRNSYLGVMPAEDLSLVTSGPYERFFMQDGKRYHHILDARTGYPAESGLVSSTVICADSMLADCLSTSTFILGLEGGKALVESVPGASAIFVESSGEVVLVGAGAAPFALQEGSGYFLRK